MTRSETRPRILQIGKFYAPYAGGIETHLQELCGELQRFADVRVIVSNIDRQTVTEDVSGIPVRRVGLLGYLAGAPVSPGMVSAIRHSPADIVQIHWPNPAAVLAYLASGHRGRLVMTYHSDVIKRKISSAVFDPILNATMARCSAVIATSPDYVRTSPVLRKFQHLCHVIPYGIATDRLGAPNEAAVAGLRQKYGPRMVLAVGRLVYYKGFEYLIQAMGLVNGRLVIVGDGPLREKLRSLSRSLGVADRVELVGEKCGDDLVPYFHAADVFALPSVARSEAFGIVQLEAMACGKPVVNTEIDSGVPFVSLHGITGLTVRPADPESLAASINKLLNDDNLRFRYGKAGRQRVIDEFRLEMMIQRTCQLYRQILTPSIMGEGKPSPCDEKYPILSNILAKTRF
jgi:glycosyltransferase involved in cell wall biosynthesis